MGVRQRETSQQSNRSGTNKQRDKKHQIDTVPQRRWFQNESMRGKLVLGSFNTQHELH